MNSSRDLMSTVQALSTGILQSVSVRQSLHMENLFLELHPMTIFEFQMPPFSLKTSLVRHCTMAAGRALIFFSIHLMLTWRRLSCVNSALSESHLACPCGTQGFEGRKTFGFDSKNTIEQRSVNI